VFIGHFPVKQEYLRLSQNRKGIWENYSLTVDLRYYYSIVFW